jgi:hypothetical protein
MSIGSYKSRPASLVRDRRAFTGETPDLFQHLAQAPAPDLDLDINLELLGALNTALRQARQRGQGRERIVDRMNAHLPHSKGVTLRQLNSWTAVSQEYKEFPARYLPAFCAATECDLPLRVLAQPIGQDLIDAREADTLRLGHLRLESARLAREQHALTRQLERS